MILKDELSGMLHGWEPRAGKLIGINDNVYPTPLDSSSVTSLNEVGTTTMGVTGSFARKASTKAKISAGSFLRLWIMIASAPASVKAKAPGERVLPCRVPESGFQCCAQIMKSLVFWAFFPARILLLKFSMVSWVWTTSVPKREFFFSPVLSSMTIMLTPMRSRVRTV